MLTDIIYICYFNNHKDHVHLCTVAIKVTVLSYTIKQYEPTFGFINVEGWILNQSCREELINHRDKKGNFSWVFLVFTWDEKILKSQ